MNRKIPSPICAECFGHIAATAHHLICAVDIACDLEEIQEDLGQGCHHPASDILKVQSRSRSVQIATNEAPTG